MQIETLRSLRDRAAAATEADRELDEAIALQCGWKQHDRYGWIAPDGWPSDFALIGLPYFTASLDASVALVERMLPGWEASGVIIGGRPKVALFLPSPIRPMPIIGKAPTPALALICALLDALIEQAEGKV